MKRLLLFIVMVLAILGIAYGNPVEEKLPNIPEEQAEAAEDPNYKITDISVLMEVDMDKKLLTEVKDAVSYYPQDILTAFNDEGWKVMIVSTIDFTDSRYEGESDIEPNLTVGLTNYKTKIIQVKDMGLTGAVRLKLLHEMAHYADSYYDYPSYTDDCKTLYDKYKDSYVEYEFLGVAKNKENEVDLNYATSNAQEFFACGMKDYLYYPEYLKSDYPELDKYFETLLKSGIKRSLMLKRNLKPLKSP